MVISSVCSLILKYNAACAIGREGSQQSSQDSEVGHSIDFAEEASKDCR